MKYFLRILRMLLGFTAFAFGTVIMMDSNVGYGPWEVFHAGMSYHLPITIGQASMIVGFTLLAIDYFLKEAIGFATAINMFVVGSFLDAFLAIPNRPSMSSYLTGIPYLCLGLLICALGTYLYMSAALGTGPRDGIMVAIRRHTGFPVGVARFILEMTVALLGWAMGGPIGVGTLITALGFGSFIQLVFSIFHFDPAKIKHDTLKDTWMLLRGKLKSLRSK